MYKTRTDENQKDIVEKLRKAGCKVWTHGNGTIDLTVKYPSCGIAFMVEVKKGNQESAHKKLTNDQKKFFGDFVGCGNAFITTSAEYALKEMGLVKKKYAANNEGFDKGE